MAKVTQNQNGNNGNNNGNSEQQKGGQTYEVNVNHAFGFAGDTSRAGAFVAEIKAQFERNGNTYGYHVDTIRANYDHASVAFVSFMYEQTPVYALALFETNNNAILTYQDGMQSRYTTVASLIGNEHINDITTRVKEQCGYHVDPVFVTLQVVPRSTNLDSETSRKIAAQMVTSIEARGERYGTLKTSEYNKLAYDFRDQNQGAVLDSNGVPQRADWALEMITAASDTSQSNKPVLVSSPSGNHLPATVRACGYVGLRYVGPESNPADFVDQPSRFKPAQLNAEIVIGQLDAVTAGVECSYERSLETLAGIARIAQVGGWKRPLMNSLNGPKRKLSALAQHLHFVPGMEIDYKSFDKDQSAAIDMLVKETAAVVVKYRKGDGIAGLAQLLSEIAYGETSSVNILLNKLDSLYDNRANKKFSVAYAEALGREIAPTDIVATAVPVPAGSYSGSNGLSSLDDMDLIDVANRIGDNFEHFRNYVQATSYDNRLQDVEGVMMYQMELAKSFYGPNDLRLLGDALDMVMNPEFLGMLLTYHANCVSSEYNGVIEHTNQGQGLFIGGGSFTVAGQNAPRAQQGFGVGGVHSQYKF